MPMWNRAKKDATPELSPCRAPAAGCFGQLRATESYAGHAKPTAEEVIADWQAVAERYYLIGYRDGRRR